MKFKWNKILFGLVLLTGFVIFFRLGRHDMLSDDGHYAFRSVGYFDYLGSLVQITPVQWFGHRPVWSFLSFHDHPPLFFLIQHIFFKVFWISTIVSRLPSALAAVGSLLVVFFLGRQLAGEKAALFSTAALALNNYFVWTGRLGLLESAFVFFALLGLLYFVKAWQEGGRAFIWSGFFFGLAFLTKYTFLFLLPGIVIFLLWKKRSIFRNKHFWFGVLTFAILCSPIVIYNLAMFKTRGHFDVQMADLFKQSNRDWTNLQHRVGLKSFSPVGMVQTLVSGFSWPYFLLFLGTLIRSFYLIIKRKASDGLTLLVLVSFSLVVFLTSVGAAYRWVGVLSPFAALLIGFAIADLVESRFYQGTAKLVFQSLGMLFGLFFLFYLLNTNTFYRAVGPKNILYSDFRVENYGYRQLDSWVSDLVDGASTPPVIHAAIQMWWYGDIDPQAKVFADLNQNQSRDFNSLIVYDANTDWFQNVWIFERWKLYHNILIMNSDEFAKVLSDGDYHYFNQMHLDGVYYIRSGSAVRQKAQQDYPESKLLETFQKNHVEPQIIYDDQHREAFYIYHGDIGFQ